MVALTVEEGAHLDLGGPSSSLSLLHTCARLITSIGITDDLCGVECSMVIVWMRCGVFDNNESE